MIDLRQVQAFVAVAEEMSFTRAAARLHIGTSGLSAQIRKLEAKVGGRLFERTPRRVEPTRLGRDLYLPAQDLLASAQRFSDAAFAPSGKRTVVMAIAENGVNQLALTLLSELRSVQPDIDLEIRPVALRNQHVRSGDDVDVLIARPPFDGRPSGDVVRHPVASDPIILMAHASLPVADRDFVVEADIVGTPRLRTGWVPDAWATAHPAFRDDGSSQNLCTSFRDAAAEVSVARTACVMPRSFALTYNVPDVVVLEVRDAAPMTVEFVVDTEIDDELHRAVVARYASDDRLVPIGVPS